MQTRIQSAVESFANLIIAFVISWSIMQFVVPVFWPTVQVKPMDSFGITLLYTIVSFSRIYLIRRYFTYKSNFKQR